MLKAFTVFSGESPHVDGCALIFAETHSKARYLGMVSCPFTWTDDYIHWRAWRAPEFDKYANQCAQVVEFNHELPEEAPRFYLEDEA